MMTRKLGDMGRVSFVTYQQDGSWFESLLVHFYVKFDHDCVGFFAGYFGFPLQSKNMYVMSLETM